LVGASLLAALCLKANAIAFLLGPAVVLFHAPARQLWNERRQFAVRAAGAGALLLLVVSMWLLGGSRGPALRETMVEATWPGAFFAYLAAGNLAEFPGHYLQAVWGRSWEMAYYTVLQSFTPLFSVPIAAGYLFFFLRRRGCEDPQGRLQRAAMFGWFIVPVLGLLLGLRDLFDERYLLPLLPQASALLAVTLVELPTRRLKALLTVGVLLVGTLNFALVGFRFLPNLRPLACLQMPGWTSTDRVDGSLWTCAAYPEYRFMDRPTHPDRQDWAHDLLEGVLSEERDRLGRPLRAVFLDDLYDLFYRAFQRDLLQADLYRHEDMLLVTRCWDEAWIASVWGSTEALIETIGKADILLMRYGSPDDQKDTALRGRRCTIFDEHAFRLEKELPLLDGTKLRVYFRK